MITARDQGVGRLAPIRVRKVDENAVGLHVRKVDEKRGRSTRSHYAYSIGVNLEQATPVRSVRKIHKFQEKSLQSTSRQ